MKRNQQRLTLLSLVVVILFISSSFSSVRTKAYDWDVTQTVTLQEYDNTGYGVLTGNHAMENQYLEAQYDTDIRYVREPLGSTTQNMANSSKDFRASFTSLYYQSNNQFVKEDDKWINFPTYIQAFNNTGTGPNLNFTVGVKNQGELLLNKETALELEAEVLYRYIVTLKADDIYDLNIKTTDSLTYYFYFEEQLAAADTINGISRDVQLLASRGRGDYELFFYSSSDNYIIIKPRDISVSRGSVNIPVSGYFLNKPDLIWNETKNLFEDNLKKETVHAYYFDVSQGDYQFKYIRFDNSITTRAHIVVPLVYYEEGSYYSFLDFTLGTGSFEKFDLHFEFDTQVLVYITAETDNIDYIEFDYLLSIRDIEVPLLEEGQQYQYQDDMINFGINIEQKQMIYLNYSLGGTTDVWLVKHEESGLMRGQSYDLEQYGEDAAKIMLDPGYYSFLRPVISSYDFNLEFNAIDFELFNTTSMSFNLEQENGDVSNYKLLKFEMANFAFVNYNFSMTMQNNYTVDLSYQLFVGDYAKNTYTSNFVLGNQEDDGIFQAYPSNNSQALEFFTIRPNSVRYLLIYIRDVYNNTGYSWPTKGDAYVNQTSVLLRIREDPGKPEAFDNTNVHFIDANLSGIGEGSYSTSFTDVVNDRDLYLFNATVPELTWYKIKIVIVNGTRDSTYYTYDNPDSIRPSYFYRSAVWNEYYYLDSFDGTFFRQYDSSNFSQVTWEVEFGVYSPNLIFMFSVNHAGYNGTFSIEFIPYNCTEIKPIDFTSLGGLSTGAIIGISIAAGLVVAGGIAALVIKVIVPKIKSKTP